MGPLMDHGIWKWIKSYRAAVSIRDAFISLENEPGRWSPLASRVESTAYCELLLVNPLSLIRPLARTLVAPVSKRGGSFYNRIYRRTGGTAKRTCEGVKRTRRDIVRLEIWIASKLRSEGWALLSGRWTQRSLNRDWIGFELNLRLFVYTREMRCSNRPAFHVENNEYK